MMWFNNNDELRLPPLLVDSTTRTGPTKFWSASAWPDLVCINDCSRSKQPNESLFLHKINLKEILLSYTMIIIIIITISREKLIK